MNQAANSLGKLFTCGVLVFAAPTFPVTAQITPDNTLGAESSRLDTNVLINNVLGDKINGGAQRDTNLFHSFSEFNINDGQRVYFSNPSGVINILTRVTGGVRSNILGTLGVDGNANLFLMNPNGIFFGQNASLDVRGSFVGTTANGLQFGNQGVFSATNPQTPGLLTVNPSALVFSQVQSSAGITNQSQAPAGVSPNGNNTRGLRVPDGKSLLLVGGNVNLDGGSLRAYDGRIELTGLTTPGNIGLNLTGDIFSLNIPNDVAFADVSLDNNSVISIFGNKGGDIAINARNININDSALFAGIAKDKGSPTTQAGDITLNATGNITLTGNASSIDNRVYENATGNGGNIRISANSLALKDNADLSTYTFGNGNGGTVFLQVNDAVTLESGDIFSTVEAGAIGNGGDINIQAGSLTLTDSAQLLTVIRPREDNLPAGKGNGGNVNINVRGAVIFANPKPGFINGISSEVEKDVTGNGGNVTINAASVDITGGSEIQGSTSGKGNAGNITINARDSIRFDGKGETGSFSRAIASVQEGAEGNAGNINITTGTLELTNGAFLSSSTFGQGNAGSININTDILKLTNRSFLTSSTFSQGNAANITINARDISFDTRSRASSEVSKTGFGNGGEIRISTNSLSLTNGGEISSDVLGQGNAGNIFIDAKDSVKVDGVLVDAGKLDGNNLDFDAWSNISSDLLGESIGKAGNIEINTPSLSLTNSGQISSTSGGQGDAGNITINAPSNVIISGFAGRYNTNSQISSYVVRDAVGNGGDIRINTGNLTVKNGGAIGTNNGGIGNGGNIFLDVSDTITFEGFGGNGQSSEIASFAVNGNAGNVEINTGSLFLGNGGYISSLILQGKGNAGNIIINARDTVKFEGWIKDGKIVDASSSLSSALLNGEGEGGDIEITTGSLFVINGANISANTSGQGNAGNITINAKDTVTFDGGVNGLPTTASNSTLRESTGSGGDIRINARELFLRNGGLLSALSGGSGNAGNIFIEAADNVLIDGGNGKNIITQATTFAIGGGNGGNIQVKTGSLRLTNGGQLTTYATRNAGNIDINARDTVFIDGVSGDTQSGAFTLLLPGGVGKGGEIQVRTNSLTVSNRGQLGTVTFGQGDAGNILINAFGDINVKNGSTINAATAGQGNAGDITVNAGGKFFLEGTTADGFKFDTGVFTVVASDSGFTGQGQGGDINVTVRDLFLNGATIAASNFVEGIGGDININSGTVRLDNKAAIASVTNSGNGGDIFLDIKDFLVLRNNSNISTTAGLQQFSGDGGNITLNTAFIVAVPGENSDITANAFTGKGGQINITTQGIFGIEPRAQASDATNDITASSQLGIQGEIAINNPEIDPTKGIIELPNEVVDATNQLSQLCPRGYDAFIKPLSSFTITGRDALPLSPLEPLQGTATIPLATLDNEGNAGIQERTNNTLPISSSPNLRVSPSPSSQIIEAQALIKNSQGEIFLVAQAPQTTPSSQPTISACL